MITTSRFGKTTSSILTTVLLGLFSACSGGGEFLFSPPGSDDSAKTTDSDARAVLSFSEGAGVHFGEVFKGEPRDRTLTISNEGNAAATKLSASTTLAAPFSFKGGSFPGAGGTCAKSLAPGTSCTVVVSFAPTADLAMARTLEISYNDAKTLQSVKLQLQGLGNACDPTALPFGGGDGDNAPFLICSVAQLQEVHNHLNASFKLESDLDLANVSFAPIGTAADPFRGVFDGGRKVIRNFTFNEDANANFVGFFGNANHATIQDLRLSNVAVKGLNFVAGLAGFADNWTTITGCHTSGTVAGVFSVGGLVGQAIGSFVGRSSSTAQIARTTSNFFYAGGLIGAAWATNVSDTFAEGSVQGAGTSVGGLIGEIAAGSTLNTSYSVANVPNGGGLIGTNNGISIITNSFWDTQASHALLSPGGGIGHSTTEMQTKGTFTNWDFDTVWFMPPNDYPKLRDMLEEGGCDPTALPFGGGDGSSIHNPYLICSVSHLQNVHDNLSAYFQLTTSIDLAGVAFEPIGDSAHPFKGWIWGHGFKILDFSYDNPDRDEVGFFGAAEDASIQNLDLVGVNLRGRIMVGGLVGSMGHGNIASSSVSNAQIVGRGMVGGLAGSSSAVIEQSSAEAEITGEHELGGLVGIAWGGIFESFATGVIHASENMPAMIGGLLGNAYMVTVYDSYAATFLDASSTSEIGGLIGRYVGVQNITHSYWDTNVSQQGSSAGGEGKTTAEMKDPNTFVGWTHGWVLTAGDYPRLR